MRSFKTDTIKQSRRQAELEQYAWRNRRAMTASEAVLWEQLRGGRLGVAFRRQVVLCDRFIVDFYAPAARLVVEVDGGFHVTRRAADARRDCVLVRAGVRVLRLRAEQVLMAPGECAAAVGRALRGA